PVLQHLSPFLSSCTGLHRHQHSFPTRRSSDLRHARRIDEHAHGQRAVRMVEAEIDRLGHDRDATFGDHELSRTLGTRIAIRDREDRKSTRLNSSHRTISYAVFCLKKKKNNKIL